MNVICGSAHMYKEELPLEASINRHMTCKFSSITVNLGDLSPLPVVTFHSRKIDRNQSELYC